MKNLSKRIDELQIRLQLASFASVTRMIRRPISLAVLLCVAFSGSSAIGSEVPEKFSSQLGIQVDTIYTHDDNVTRGYTPLLSDNSIEISARKSLIVPMTGHSRTVVTGTLDGNFYQFYKNLSHISGGIKGSVEYRGSAEFTAPTYSLFLTAFLDQYNSRLRDGQHYSAGISFRRPLTDRIRFYAALNDNKRKGASPIFDDSDNSITLNLDFDLTRTGTVYLGGELHHGDIVTTNNVNYFSNVWDDAFPGALFCAKLGGKTEIYTLGYNWGFSSKDSIDFSMRKIKSTLDSSSSSLLSNYGIWTSGYNTNQYSIAYLKRF